MTRLLLIHGSVTNAAWSWPRQRPLRERFEVVAPNRPGFPPGPTVVRPGDHLAAHSYGGIGALLVASELPLASLTLIESPVVRRA